MPNDLVSQFKSFKSALILIRLCLIHVLLFVFFLMFTFLTTNKARYVKTILKTLPKQSPGLIHVIDCIKVTKMCSRKLIIELKNILSVKEAFIIIVFTIGKISEWNF